LWIVVADADSTRGRFQQVARNERQDPSNPDNDGSQESLAHSNGSGCGEQRGAESVRPKFDSIKCGCEDVAYAARIQQGREEQRPEWKRVGEGCESVGKALADSEIDGRISRRTGDAEEVERGRKSDRGSVGTDSMGDANRPPSDAFAQEGRSWRTVGKSSWWESEPSLGRVAHGISDRVASLKALGNAQVPLVAATAWRLLNNG